MTTSPHKQQTFSLDHQDTNRSVSFFGIPVVDLTMHDLVTRVEHHLLGRQPTHIVNLNPHHFLIAQNDVDFGQICKSGDIVFADGIGIAFASILGDRTIHNRFTGLDLMTDLCRLSAEKGYSIFLFGGQHGIVDRCAENLRSTFPRLRIVGSLEPPLANDVRLFENHGIIRTINEANPDILFVALGAPKQEKWIEHFRGKLSVPIMMGVGGSFDILGGRFSRAPRWMRAAGLEWLFRLATEPTRLAYRYLVGIPRFIALVVQLRLRPRKENASR